MTQAPPLWDLAATLCAVDPGLGGLVLRGPQGAGRERWLARWQAWLGPQVPWRRLPVHVDDDALFGGLDLGATLSAGRAVGRQGVLAGVHGGVLVVPMAERMGAGLAARLAAVLDTGRVAPARAGLDEPAALRLTLVLLDEGVDEPEQAPAALCDRVAFVADALAAPGPQQPAWRWTPDDIARARTVLPRVRVEAPAIEALCQTAQSLGIASLRAPQLALRAARALAALEGLTQVGPAHLERAAALVLAPRAVQWPASPPDATPDHQAPPQQPPASEQAGPQAAPPEGPDAPPEDCDPPEADAPMPPAASGSLPERLLLAVQAHLPAGLLARLQAGLPPRSGRAAGGKAGAQRRGGARGRPLGTRAGQPGGGARLNAIETLRAAAPWQPLRAGTAARPGAPRIQVRRQDFRVVHRRERSPSVTLFVVDASGSQALHRLGEAKGAVELLLAECYVRRDRVALIAFRGAGAQLLLPPTRSLVRAKRSLAALPGGGGTPLAAGLQAARGLAGSLLRRGETPTVVVLTDGRANIALDGAAGRAQATADAHQVARTLRAAALRAIVVDTAPTGPAPAGAAPAQALAREIGAHYLRLPASGAAGLSRAVQALTQAQAD